MIVCDHAPVILKDVYDPNQSWLPFAGAPMIFSVEEEPTHLALIEQHQRNKRALEVKARQRFATMPDQSRALFQYKKGVPQLPLPFPGYRRLSHKEYKRLSEADYPCWERTLEGKIAHVKMRKEDGPAAIAWMAQHGKGRYHTASHGQYMAFERLDDASMIMMQFGFAAMA